MATGTVKWYDQARGFGFIRPDEGGPDVFVAAAAITADGVRSLSEGQQVQYELRRGPRGDAAENVRPGRSG